MNYQYKSAEVDRDIFSSSHTVLVPSEFSTDDFSLTISPLTELAPIDSVREKVTNSEEQQVKKRKQNEQPANQSTGVSKNRKVVSKTSETQAKKTKICAVCGGKARGCNFNAISCESCRSFFRRNALKDMKQWDCPSQGNCKIGISSRKFCPSCRLRKCFEVGMKPELLNETRAAAQLLEQSSTDLSGQEDCFDTGHWEETLVTTSEKVGEKRQLAKTVPTALVDLHRNKDVGYSETDALPSVVPKASNSFPRRQDAAVQTDSNRSSPVISVSALLSAFQTANDGGDMLKITLPKPAFLSLRSSPNGLPEGAASSGVLRMTSSSAEAKSSNMIEREFPFTNIQTCEHSAINRALVNTLPQVPIEVAVVVKQAQPGTGYCGRETGIGFTNIDEGAIPQAPVQNLDKHCLEDEARYIPSEIQPTSSSYFGIVDPFGQYLVDANDPANYSRSLVSSCSLLPATNANAMKGDTRLSHSTSSCQSLGGIPTSPVQNLSDHCLVDESNYVPLESPLTLCEFGVEDPFVEYVQDDAANYWMPQGYSYSVPPTSNKNAIQKYSVARNQSLFPSCGYLYPKETYTKLQELLMANEVWAHQSRAQIPPLFHNSSANFCKVDALNMVHNAIRCITKMNSQLSLLKSLEMADQIALLKGSAQTVMQVMKFGKGDANAGLIYLGYPGMEYVPVEDIRKHFKRCMCVMAKYLFCSYPEKWRNDDPVILALGAIYLFNPDHPNVQNRHAVMAARRLYQELLMDYLVSKSGETEGRKVYEYLISWLEHRLAPLMKTDASHMYFDVNPYSMEPMFFEIAELYEAYD